MSSALGIQVDGRNVHLINEPRTKHEALNELIDTVSARDVVTDKAAFSKALFDREAVSSTGIGGGVAIPHVKMKGILEPVVGIGLFKDGIDFDAMDGEPVKIVVLFGMPAGADKEYLQLLARVMTMLREPGFKDDLLACESTDEIVMVLHKGGL